MEEITQWLASLADKATSYGRKSLELLKLKTAEKTVDILSVVVPSVVVCALSGFFILFLSIGGALWMGEVLGELYYGFLAVAAFYGILAVAIRWLAWALIKRKVADFFVRQIFKE